MSSEGYIPLSQDPYGDILPIHRLLPANCPFPDVIAQERQSVRR